MESLAVGSTGSPLEPSWWGWTRDPSLDSTGAYTNYLSVFLISLSISWNYHFAPGRVSLKRAGENVYERPTAEADTWASTAAHNCGPSTWQEGRSEAEASLVYRGSAKIARATWRQSFQKGRSKADTRNTSCCHCWSYKHLEFYNKIVKHSFKR